MTTTVAAATTSTTTRTLEDEEDRQLHDDRLPKRRCSGGGIKGDLDTDDDAVEVSRDCYEEVTCPTGPKSLRQDWFYQIPTLHHPTTLPPALAQAVVVVDGEEARLVVHVQTELQSLDQQLQQVKRRFGLAAEHCAAAAVAHEATTKTASQEFEAARRACNPYEILGETRAGGLNHGLFLNRSAIKLANMDSLLQFGLVAVANTAATTAGLPSHHPSTQDDFTFVDLCAAPGGFSEYVLRRFCHSITQQQKQQQQQQQHAGVQHPSCTGFGMSLMGNNDQGRGTPWKLSNGPIYIPANNRGPSVYYHICTGSDGTGDIFQWANVQALQHMIASHQQLQHHQQPLVDLVLADGGVDAQRNVEHPEGETQKLVVCQAAAALALLRPGGRFLLKLLSCQTTPVLRSVLGELWNCFDTLQVLKPISSRPASAERYLVCTGYRPNPHDPVLRQGPSWISRVLLGQEQQQHQHALSSVLLQWLAQIDRDMMHLNLKACFAILSHLETRTMQLSNPHLTVLPYNFAASSTASCMEYDDDDDAWIAQGYHSYQQQQQLQQQQQQQTNATFHHNHGNRNRQRQPWWTIQQQQQSSTVDIEQYRIAWRLF